MFARIEVAMKPDFADPAAHGFLRRIELAHPEIRKKIRWARMMDVYWLDIAAPREELINGISEVFWDPVLQWLFTGNLIPSAAGKNGGVQDILSAAPHRPGKFWGIERRYRGGVTDNVGRTVLEAFEIVLARKIPEARAASGSLVILEGPTLNDDELSSIARDVFCNELIESWTLVSESELNKNERFHQERVKRDLPRLSFPLASSVETYALSRLSDAELDELSRKKLWALSLAEMKAIREHFESQGRVPTDVEMEVLAQTWSEHCKHKIFGAKFNYTEMRIESGVEIPAEINGLFKTTIAGTTEQISRNWLLSVFSDNAGIVAFDEEHAFCIKVETHNSPSALDPYGGALTGIVGVNRDILGCGMGAKPIFNTDVFCVAPLDYSDPLPDRLLHPRRILDGVRRGVEDGGNKSGIPTINGALVFDERYLGKPLVFCGTGGFMPREVAGVRSETKEIQVGDKICMVGGRIGKDGIHGATFSSLALDDSSPVSAVQLGDPITQKRAGDFLLEARDLGFYRTLTDNGAGGLSSSVGELAQLSGGARLEVGRAQTKYPGLKPFELVVSESQERMTVAVPAERLAEFTALAGRRGVEVSELGEFTSDGFFEIEYHGKTVAKLELKFLHGGVPRLELAAEWAGRPKLPESESRDFESEGSKVLLEMLGRPNIASKEWMIRQYDHEVQGTSVVKPLHTVAPGTPHTASGPNDGGVIKPKSSSESGIVVACGLNPKLSDIDPYLMAQSAVDEAVRNALAVGADYGADSSVLALVDNFCWPDPLQDKGKAAALVRACYGLQNAAVALGAPLISGKDSMKNDFRGKRAGQNVKISVPPTLLVTAVAKISEVRLARTTDFKSPGDVIYLLGGRNLGIIGSELQAMLPKLPAAGRLGEPDWELASRIYSWLGRTLGGFQVKLRSLHDVSEGGALVAIAEGLIARGLGAQIEVPPDMEPWEFGFGEGFHSFVASASPMDASSIESECRELEIPLVKIGQISHFEHLEVRVRSGRNWTLPVKQLRSAWQKAGYWE